MSPVEILLARLRARDLDPRMVSRSAWRSVCPAHVSRRGTHSLSIAESSDGTVLVRCHAGCAAIDIVHAVDLGLRDLFPSSVSRSRGGRAGWPRRPWLPRRRRSQA